MRVYFFRFSHPRWPNRPPAGGAAAPDGAVSVVSTFFICLVLAVALRKCGGETKGNKFCFSVSGRPRAAGRPYKQVGSLAPHFERFPVARVPARTSRERRISPISLAPFSQRVA